MKKYLVISMPRGKTKNLGDYIQIIAARQFYDRIDGSIEKEELSLFTSDGEEKVKAIINGWFMWKPENWPPSESIEPLLISIHFSPLIINHVLSRKDYLVKNAPIGCRDMSTLKALQENGIESYFSGCLTLTLGKTYHFKGQREGYYFVDPYIHVPFRSEIGIGNIKSIIKILFCCLTHFNKINFLSKKNFFKRYGRILGHETYTPGVKGKIKSLLKATCFYHTYHKRFSDRIIMSAEYLTHIIPVKKNYSHDDWLKLADCYLNKYLKAKMVITSRIHAALPCLAIETPVIFINTAALNSKKILFNTPSRLDGLVDFFRTMYLDGFNITTDDDVLKLIQTIDCETVFKNKDAWKEYAIKLNETCMKFMKS